MTIDHCSPLLLQSNHFPPEHQVGFHLAPTRRTPITGLLRDPQMPQFIIRQCYWMMLATVVLAGCSDRSGFEAVRDDVVDVMETAYQDMQYVSGLNAFDIEVSSADAWDDNFVQLDESFRILELGSYTCRIPESWIPEVNDVHSSVEGQVDAERSFSLTVNVRHRNHQYLRDVLDNELIRNEIAGGLPKYSRDKFVPALNALSAKTDQQLLERYVSASASNLRATSNEVEMFTEALALMGRAEELRPVGSIIKIAVDKHTVYMFPTGDERGSAVRFYRFDELGKWVCDGGVGSRSLTSESLFEPAWYLVRSLQSITTE